MSSAKPKRHAAGHLNYRGDLRSIVGELKGPTTFGSVVVATVAEYDVDTDRTRVAFGYVTPDDVKRAAVVDGLLRLPAEAVA
jgi:hypothetical protein